MLQKQTVPINFQRGLNLKSDPKQVPIGDFLSLQNSIFTKTGLLQKRNGFPTLTTLPVTNTQFLTTFNDDLTAIGTHIFAFDIPNDTWVDKATLFPCELSVLPLIRSNTNQSQADSVVSANGLVLTAFTDQNLASLTTHVFKYAIADATTGQNIIEPTLLVGADPIYGTPRVFLLGGYFVIIYTTKVVSAYHLVYIAISSTSPTTVIGPITISAAYIPATTLAFDGYVVGNKLYVAYMSALGTNVTNVALITNVATGPSVTVNFQQPSGPEAGPASVFSLTADLFIPQSPIIYVSMFVPTLSYAYTLIYDQNLNAIGTTLSPLGGVVNNMATIALDNTFTLWAEIAAFYPDGVTPNNYISKTVFTVSPIFFGVFTSGAFTAVVSSAAGLAVGMLVTDTTSPNKLGGGFGAFITQIVGTTIHLSAANTGTSLISPGDQLIAVNNAIVSPTFHSVFSSGASTITASSATGLTPGGLIFDITTPGNLGSGDGAQINSIAGAVLSIAPNTSGNSASSPGDLIIEITPVAASLPPIFMRGVGLASKAFLLNNIGYFLIAYQSPYQPTYFLVDQNADIIAKLAYSNGGGYLPTGIPNISLYGNVVSIPYLIKDSITAVNKTTNLGATNFLAGLYTQTGINLANFTLGTSSVSSSEAAQTLNLSGGFVWSYDGYVAVEQNFFLWPDYVTAAWEAGPGTSVGSATLGSTTITLTTLLAGVYANQGITDTTNPSYLTAGTIITAVNVVGGVSVLTISNPTLHAISGDTLSTFGGFVAVSDGVTTNAYFYQVIYVWTDNQGNINTSAPSIPVAVTTSGTGITGTVFLTIDTLRLTYKIANPVKIEIYRWSIANPIYYQVTSILLPLLNNTLVDTVTFADVSPDISTSLFTGIVGNEILYTTGGVVEDIGPPATSLMTLFQTRLWLVDAEDPNLLWYSKQIIERTPIEFSDLFTYYVSPTLGAQGSTGNITALAPMDDKLIIFKRSKTGTAIYYINGTGPDNTGANSQFSEPIFITSTIGCDNQQSIVFIPNGLIFQSDKGLWLLGRDLSTNYIGAQVETLTQNAVVETAINIPGTTQVRFMMNTGIVLMYDYFFTAWSVFTLTGISSTLFQGMHTYVNNVGQVFQELPGTYLDGSSPVLMSFTTAWISLAGLQGFERFYQCYLLGEYISPFTLSVSFAYDYNPSPTQSQVVVPQAFQPNWGNDALWGSSPVWGGISQVFSERVFPDQQKCETFSLFVQEVYDSTFSIPAGEGLSISGLNLVIGVKRAFRTQSAGKSS